MLVACYDSEFEVPDILIEKFLKDFDGLPGSGQRESVCQLRSSTDDIIDIIAEEPELLDEPEYLADFLKALAIQQALRKLGILHDS
jgi:hypothetical protein